MDIKNKKIGYIFTGSFCTFSKSIPIIKELKKLGADIIPIMSYNSYESDTKFGTSSSIIKEIEEITNKKIIHTIPGAEPIGPKKLTDIMVICPCSGNTISKLAYDIIDTPATMAAKSHLRNDLPIVIAVSTNNGLGANAENIGKLLNRRNYYYVTFTQDKPITKQRSVLADFNMVIKTIEYALDGKQISPILI